MKKEFCEKTDCDLYDSDVAGMAYCRKWSTPVDNVSKEECIQKEV